MKANTRHPAGKSPRKKRYSTPSLTVHGDLRRLTQTTKRGMNSDGAGKPMTRMSGAQTG